MGESWVPMMTPSNNVDWAKACLHTKWHLDPSNRLATIHQRYRQTGQRCRSIGRTVTCRPKVNDYYSIGQNIKLTYFKFPVEVCICYTGVSKFRKLVISVAIFCTFCFSVTNQ